MLNATSVEPEGRVPLSKDEERILSEIEQQLYESDPRLAREVSETTIYTDALHRLKWSIFGFVGGVALMVVTLSTSYLLAFVGFLGMLGSALVLERSIRRLGKAGLEQGRRSQKTASIRGALGSTRQKMRERFERGESGRN
ncbi:uncharacterized protein METZ01_LOCUS187416 [marine metagenome]|uniref:DUF3040 domain-containing protein n=1 Tax=marine metagenome TaxID=408172 RepID=A0A382D953_9ZZZZ